MPAAVEFGTPAWLLAAPLVAGFLVAARLPWWRAARRAGRRAVRQEGARLAVRLVWASLLLMALAGANLVRPLHRQATAFVLDVSASVAPARDQGEAAIRAATSRLPQGDLAGVVVAASGARVEEAPLAEPLFSRLATALPDGASDLAAGLRLAGAVLPEGYTRHVVLLSDGRQTRGDAVAAARDLAARGMVVDVLPMGAEAGPDVRLEAVDLSATAYHGEVSTLTARVYAGLAATATVRVYRDDQLVVERAVELRSGRQDVALPVPVGEPGLHRYRVDVAADPTVDATAANNALGAVQRVAGPPRALVVAAGSDAAPRCSSRRRSGAGRAAAGCPSGCGRRGNTSQPSRVAGRPGGVGPL
jgi:Ca-activated chloride channel family protein